MLDLFCIFTTGGLLLWYKHFSDTKFELLINTFIKSVLLEERRTLQYFTLNGSIIRWKIHNQSSLIFAAAYQESFNLLYVDELIDIVSDYFIKHVLPLASKRGDLYLSCPSYDSQFSELLSKWESKARNIIES
jgi:hypothetical protein